MFWGDRSTWTDELDLTWPNISHFVVRSDSPCNIALTGSKQVRGSIAGNLGCPSQVISAHVDILVIDGEGIVQMSQPFELREVQTWYTKRLDELYHKESCEEQGPYDRISV